MHIVYLFTVEWALTLLAIEWAKKVSCCIAGCMLFCKSQARA